MVYYTVHNMAHYMVHSIVHYMVHSICICLGEGEDHLSTHGCTLGT